tara:strand:+ start:270 stop:494 length:225 start_codon:yes stop_codon:yes gene_type:complete
MKAGDLVKMCDHHADAGMGEHSWRGIVLRQEPLIGGLFDDEEEEPEWVIHWLHYPHGEESFEYGYYLEVISESR